MVQFKHDKKVKSFTRKDCVFNFVPLKWKTRWKAASRTFRFVLCCGAILRLTSFFARPLAVKTTEAETLVLLGEHQACEHVVLQGFVQGIEPLVFRCLPECNICVWTAHSARVCQHLDTQVPWTGWGNQRQSCRPPKRRRYKTQEGDATGYGRGWTGRRWSGRRSNSHRWNILYDILAIMCVYKTRM